MLNILIKFIFTIITKIGDIILLPIISLLSAVIPSFSSFYDGILSFFDYAFTYLFFFIKLLCIPKVCITAVLTVALATLTITTSIRLYTFIMRIYTKFKP